MKFPELKDYEKAMMNFGKNVLSPRFLGGIPEKQGYLFNAYTGGYSRIYAIKLASDLVGLRCWLGDVDGQESRYLKARSYFMGNWPRYFTDFEYIEQGIWVKDKVWPILYMKWVDGIRLNEFLDKHIRDAQVINDLSHVFLEMVNQLHHLGVSHGDLQDGNIMVQNNKSKPTIQLIDYDTIYVPTMNDNSDFCVGIPNYQHPKRKSLKLNPKCADYFSELVIYLSLRAYAERPEWWSIGQEQHLLFDAKDLNNPDSSHVFKELSKLSDEVSYLSAALQYYCRDGQLSNILPVEKLLSKYNFDVSANELDRYFNHSKGG